MAVNLLESGLWLTLYGMGTVFVFLILLTGATGLMSRLALRLEVPRHVPGPESYAVKGNIAQRELVAVISAAIRQHRMTRRSKVQ